LTRAPEIDIIADIMIEELKEDLKILEQKLSDLRGYL